MQQIIRDKTKFIFFKIINQCTKKGLPGEAPQQRQHVFIGRDRRTDGESANKLNTSNSRPNYLEGSEQAKK